MAVEVASCGDPHECGRILAAAFADEPGLGWICGPGLRARRHWFVATLRAHAGVPGGTHYLAKVAGEAAGAAVVTPANRGPRSLAQLAWITRVGLGCGPPTVQRTLRYLGASTAPADALTLEFLGVLPDQRGRGVGRALLERTIADVAGQPIYLTTADPSNPGLYRRFGWQETGRVNVGGLVVVAMCLPGEPING